MTDLFDAPGADVNAGISLDTLGFERASVDPFGSACTLQSLVGAGLPDGTEPLSAVWCEPVFLAITLAIGEPQHTLASFVVPIAKCKMGVRVLSILTHVVNGRDPGHTSLRYGRGEVANELRALNSIELARKRNHDLINEASILGGGVRSNKGT